MMKFKNFLILSGILLTAINLTGCASVPFIQAYKELGATPGDRQVLLEKDLKDFSQARHWGKAGVVLAKVVPESQGEIRNELLRAKRSKERIVESNVEIIDFDDESYNATVNLAVRYFAVPSYIVEDRYEKHQWTFEMGSGWKLQSMTTDAEPYATN